MKIMMRNFTSSCAHCTKEIHGKSLQDFVKRVSYHYDCVNCMGCKGKMKGYVKSCRTSTVTNFFHEKCFHCVTCKNECDSKDSCIFNEQLFCVSCIPCIVCKGQDEVRNSYVLS